MSDKKIPPAVASVVDEWFEDINKEKPVDLERVKELGRQIFQARKVIDKIEEELSELSLNARTLEDEMLAILTEAKLEKFHLPGLGLVYTESKFSYKVPANLEEKMKFFHYLKDKNMLWESVSMNSNTLNSFCKMEMAAAVARGDTNFKVPGIEDPISYTKLKVKKEK